MGNHATCEPIERIACTDWLASYPAAPGFQWRRLSKKRRCFRRDRTKVAVVWLILSAPLSVSAQVVPWQVFTDGLNGSTCDVVHASNADLVVLSTTGQLVIVSGQDITLQDTAVDAAGFVFFEGVEAGLISFQPDGNGTRTLWWTSLTGRLVSVDDFTGTPTVSELFPSDFAGLSCDACDFWDDQTLCGDAAGNPPDTPQPPLTITLCGVSVPIASAMILTSLTAMSLVRRRSR